LPFRINQKTNRISAPARAGGPVLVHHQGMSLNELEHFYAWRFGRLPELSTPQGIEIFIWLLKNARKSLTVTSLYRASRFSEPTVRKCLRAFVVAGYVEVEFDSGDTRRHLIKATDRLYELAEEYGAWLGRVALEADNPEAVGDQAN